MDGDDLEELVDAVRPCGNHGTDNYDDYELEQEVDASMIEASGMTRARLADLLSGRSAWY